MPAVNHVRILVPREVRDELRRRAEAEDRTMIAVLRRLLAVGGER